MEQVLTLAASCNDFSFIDSCFDTEFFYKYGRRFLTYEENVTSHWTLIPDTSIISREYEDIKNALLFKSFNLTIPRIFIKKGASNYEDKGGLYLVHDISIPLNLNLEPRQLTLEPEYARDVLKAIHRVWGQTVFLETIDEDGKDILMSYSEKEGFYEQPLNKQS